jgi:hypothetical protein
MLSYADVCRRMPTYADVCCRMLTYADVCRRMRKRADQTDAELEREERLADVEGKLRTCKLDLATEKQARMLTYAHVHVCSRMLTYADASCAPASSISLRRSRRVCSRMLTYAAAYAARMLKYADVCCAYTARMLTYADV